MKILCVIIPHFQWTCEVLRQPGLEGRETIITSTSGSQKLVLDFSPEMDDLWEDMPLQQALSRHGQAGLLTADIPFYRSVFNEMLDALEDVSPLGEGAEPGRAYIDAEGLQLMYPNDDVLIDAVRDSLPQAFSPCVGLAGNKFLAYLAARRCPPGGRLVLTGNVANFLKDLPCDVLPISIKNKNKLHTFGIRTLGTAAALPTGPLLSQFGPEGKRIKYLAAGIDDTPLNPRMLQETIEESTTLSSVSVAIEAMLATVTALLEPVFERIVPAGKGIASLTLWTKCLGSEQWEKSVRFKEPAMDIKKALSRIKLVLEEYPQPGPVEQMGIRIDRLGYPRGRQKSLFSEVRAKDHLRDDIKQLELRLGNPQVYRMREVEPWSRIPERRYALMHSVR